MWLRALRLIMLASLLQLEVRGTHAQSHKPTETTSTPKLSGSGAFPNHLGLNPTNNISTGNPDAKAAYTAITTGDPKLLIYEDENLSELSDNSTNHVGLNLDAKEANTSITTLAPNLVSYPGENSSEIGYESVSAGGESCRDVHLGTSIVYGVLSVGGLVGNGISIAVLRLMPSSMASSLLLSVLAIWDSVYLLIMLLVRVVQPIAETFFNVMKSYGSFVYAFKYISILLALSQLISTYTIVILTCHRYIAVCRPHHAARLCRPAVAKWQLFFVHIASLLFLLPLSFDVEVVPVQTSGETIYGHRFTSWGKNRLYQVLYRSVLYSVVVFGVPLSTLTVMSILLIRAVREANKRRAAMSSGKIVANEDITKILIAVVVVFLICQIWRPIVSIMLAVSGSRCGTVYRVINTFSNIMLNINGSINFLIYIWFGESFRKILKTMFCRRSDAKPQAKKA